MTTRLSPAQLLCLQCLGYRAPKIFDIDGRQFEQIFQSVPGAGVAWEKAAAVLQRQAAHGISTLPYWHPNFPAGLRNVGPDCPPLLHLSGNAALLRRPAVAVIGARHADPRGYRAAYRWGAAYAQRGYVVISGLALGCDTAAHLGCLDAGGDTVAVVATGLDRTHPRENRTLQERILAQGGLLLSEQPLDVKANPTRLVARNRLQAALSQEVVVTQCPVRSGTMYTVGFAQKYGKVVRAVRYPGHDALCSGNAYLIDAGIAVPL